MFPLMRIPPQKAPKKPSHIPYLFSQDSKQLFNHIL